jgi:VCBS repeat-containing protein
MATTTPITQSYLSLRYQAVFKYEGNYAHIYLDSLGLPTVGIGTLIYKGGLQTQATSAIENNVSNAQLAKDVFAAIGAAKGNRTALEKVFVLEDRNGHPALVRFKNNSNETDSSKWTDISNFLPDAQARSVLAAMAGKYEANVNLLIDRAKTFDANFAPTEAQRVALLTRMYNGLDIATAEKGGAGNPEKLASGDPLQIFEVFTWGRGGDNGNANGHISRSIDEFSMFLGDKAHLISTTENRKGVYFTDQDGKDVVIGYDTDAKGSPRAMFAYRYSPTSEGEPQRFEYFDPTAGGSTIPVRMQDKLNFSVMDAATRAETLETMTSDAVSAAGLTGEAAVTATSKIKKTLEENSGTLSTSDGVGYGVTGMGLRLYDGKRFIDIKLDGSSKKVAVLADESYEVQLASESISGPVVLTYRGEDADHTSLTSVAVDGTDVTNDPRYSFNGDGDLVYKTQQGNAWGGVVLTGKLAGQAYVYVDRNLDPDGSGIRDVSFNGSDFPSNSDKYSLTLSNGKGLVTIIDVQPVIQNLDGADVAIGTQRTTTIEKDGITLSVSKTESATDPVSGIQREITDVTTYASATASFVSHEATRTEFDFQNGTSFIVRSSSDQNGNLLERSTTEITPNGLRTTTNEDGGGNITSVAKLTTYEDGSTSQTVRYADGRILRTNTDEEGNITSRASIQTFEESGTRLETVTYADGRIVKLTYDSDSNLISQQEVESGAQTLQQAIGQYGSTVIDALSILRAIQSGQPLPILASGLRLANDVSNIEGASNYTLSGAANAASGILSLLSLDAALERGDTLGAVTAGAQALSFGATAYADFAYQNAANLFASGSFAEGVDAIEAGAAAAEFGSMVGEALPYLNLVNAIVNGDETGIVVAVASYFVPFIGWAYAVYSIISSLFGGDDAPDIPDPWGNGRFVWNGNGISLQTAGETGGNEAVSNVMSSVLATMNALIERERQQNPGAALGVIPNRMPSLGYDMSGYRYTDIDPLTGAEQHPALRFDTSGRPYNAEPGSPESYQSLVEGIVRSALSRDAIAPLWEVQTAKAQTDAGDPKAGLTEEERAGRDGQLAAPITGTTQTFRAVALDLDGDGIETTDKAHGVAFDVDDSRFLKQTAWIKSDDALLTLDRNYNGITDSGRELFSNGTVALGRRGLAGMAWVDSNYDGKLTADDPVWNELKVWRDADQDGVQDAGESQSLAALGISELNYAMGTFAQNGLTKQLGSPDLEADKDGTRVSVVPEGILVQNSADNKLSLLVTRIDDLTAVEANRDGIAGYEDTETIVSSVDLLANDTLGGFTGRDLSVTGLSNFRHGSGFLDANGFVHFNPEANYAGSEAGFDYSVLASNAQTGSGRVDLTLQNINDAPTFDHADHGTRAVYGYQPTYYDENGGSYGGGVIYEPYSDDSGYHNTPVAYVDTGAGKVIGADVDDAVASLTYEVTGQPQWGAVSMDARGNFQYTGWSAPNQPGNGYANGAEIRTDSFQVRVSDPHGASVMHSVDVTHYGPYTPPAPPGGGGGGGKKPIAVDLNGNGFEFVNVNDSNVFFDVNSDGRKHRTAWVGKDDGLLAYDIDGDGKIDKAGEISFARYKDGAQSDLEGLRAFDTNGDGLFNAADEKWSKFGVWQDTNQNGITNPGEFRTITQLGVVAVGLSSDGHFEVIDGQTVHGVGAMNRVDGSQLAIADVTFAYSNEVQVPQQGGGSATVASSPFSPSGEVIEGTAGNDLILGKTGNNIVNGYAGDDVIFEDGGNDIIDGGDGNDLIYAGADNDMVMGGNGDDAIYAGLGSDLVFGGDGNDAIFAEGGNDVVFGGAGNDLISGGAGNDVLSGDDGDDQVYGESGNDALFGRDGSDELLGMDGADRLDGGAGNDLLDGGAGVDQMLGGTGDDTYIVDNAGDTLTELAGEGNDTVRTNLDGYVLGATMENLTLSGSARLTGSGNALDNVLTGNGGNNILTGEAGNDVLDGGLGVDTLIGGAGDDEYIVDNGADVVVEGAGEGVDAVKASVSTTLAANVENLTLTGTHSINASGNELDNRLTGNSGDNLLDGGVGIDLMAGGRGNDTYVVDNLADVVLEQAGEGIDTVRASLGLHLVAQVENLVLTGSADIDGSGNELANVMVGNAGNNVLDGAAGADMLIGGAGNDTYVVDNAGDAVVEQSAEGVDTVLAGVTYALATNVENLILTGVGNNDAMGNELANMLTGNVGNNVLDGAAGADTLIGGAGSDTYVVDNAGDAVVEQSAEGVDTVLAGVTYALTANVENLTLTGIGNIDATGNELANLLSGNVGNNVLDGAIGADTLIGGAGDDTYVVDNAADVVLESAGEGSDTVRAGVTYSLAVNVENLILTGTGNTDATGNELANTLTGNSGDNVIDGDTGADVMAGAAGNDTYIVDNAGDAVIELANSGIDSIFSSVSYVLAANVENLTLTGAANNDATGNGLANTLVGNAGNNVLDGGAGADAMRGGLGNDIYRVENVVDVAWEDVSAGIDSIYTSVSYVLPENIENLYLVGDGNIGAGGNGADNVLTGNSGDNAISGGGGNDTLDGLAGNDALDGGSGNDLLLGGSGNDTLLGGTGNDQLDGGIGNDTYFINLGDGLDRIADLAGADKVQFGAGLSVDNVALRITQYQGVYTAHLRVLNAGGCEQEDQGFDFSVTVDRCGNIASPIESFQFANGSIKTLDDLLIKTRETYGRPWESSITTGRDDDIIHAGSRNDVIHSGSGNDIIFAGSGGDTVFGEGGNDYLQGGTGNDTLDGGCGTDVLVGSNGRDVLRDTGGNNAFLGGSQNDTVEAGNGNDFIAGGRHDDTISAGGGANVIGFNWGDGQDTILPGVAATNTLSLGGGLEAADLSFKKNGQDLILGAGGRDQVVFKSWYAAAANQNFVTLQVVEDRPYWSCKDGTNAMGWNIETYDFKALVQKFDTAQAANPRLSQWSLMNGLLDTHLVASNSSALGGELAVRYADGGESALTLNVSQETLKDAKFGAQAQAVGSRFDSNVCGYRLG